MDTRVARPRFVPFVRDRLTLRLALGIIALVLVPLGLGFWALNEAHYDHTIEARRQAAERENRILRVALRHQMIARDPTLMAEILDEIGSQPEVRRALILDHEGEIHYASDLSLVGQRIPRDSSTCLVCHAKDPGDRENWTILDGEAGGILRSVQPIENLPACHECHDAEQRLNGILILDTSLAGVHAQIQQDAIGMTVGALALALFLLGGVGLLVRRFILMRLTKLRRAARCIAEGQLDRRAEVRGDDVIAALASDFNSMADSVSTLVGQVRERESRLRSIMNSLDDGLVVLDRESRVVAANHSFCRRLGVHPDALSGQHCRRQGATTLMCCSSHAECPAELCAATGEVQRQTFSSTGRSGELERVEEVYASPVYDARGEVAYVVESWRDITEREKEEKRLAEIEHLVALGTLASGFSHEMNTPLATMLTSSETVLGRLAEVDGGVEPADLLTSIKDSATVIRDQAMRCRSITSRFLRFSRGIPFSIEWIDLRATIESVVNLVSPTARQSGVSVRIEDGPPVPTVRANTEVVQHVGLNLLNNAIQSCEERGGEIVLSFLVGTDVRLKIRDDGCGISPRARAHLFEPFRSQKRQGTGLGLFLSRTFMRRFGGDVRLVESAVGAGSCFEIVFQRAEETST